jgi:putative transcriptional regulator
MIRACACLLLTTLSAFSVLGTRGRQTAPIVTKRSWAPPTKQPAKGRFLIASRTLGDPNFSETVLLLLAYDATGAVGVIINQPTTIRLRSLLPDVKELRDRSERVFRGGPVAGHLLLVLVRVPTRPASSQHIFGDVYVSGSRAVLRKALGKAGKTNRLRAYAGHAGWGPGQLDREIARGDWYVAPGDAKMIFDASPAAIWPKLIERFSGEWASLQVVQAPARPRPDPRRMILIRLGSEEDLYGHVGGRGSREVAE